MDNAFLAVAKNPTLGTFLTDAAGMTLYRFTKDTEPGISTCYDKCAEVWPPLAPTDAMTLPPGVPGVLGTIARTDGGQQVTYNAIPLYSFVKDQAPGDVTGEGVGGIWFVVAPGMAHGDAPLPGAASPASS